MGDHGQVKCTYWCCVCVSAGSYPDTPHVPCHSTEELSWCPQRVIDLLLLRSPPQKGPTHLKACAVLPFFRFSFLSFSTPPCTFVACTRYGQDLLYLLQYNAPLSTADTCKVSFLLFGIALLTRCSLGHTQSCPPSVLCCIHTQQSLSPPPPFFYFPFFLSSTLASQASYLAH